MPAMGGMPVNDTAEMVVMGLDVAVVAPVIYLASRHRVPWDRLTLPWPVAVTGFVLLHAAITLGMSYAMPPPLPDAGLHLALVATAIVYWLPLIGERRLSDAGRMVYLFLSMPALDLPGVWVVARGDAGGGLGMIVGMLPLGIWTLVTSWQWMVRETATA